jgi:hypothetical protein
VKPHEFTIGRNAPVGSTIYRKFDLALAAKRSHGVAPTASTHMSDVQPSMVGRSGAQARRAGRTVAWREPSEQRWASVPSAERGVPKRSAGAPCWACRGLAGAERAAPGSVQLEVRQAVARRYGCLGGQSRQRQSATARVPHGHPGFRERVSRLRKCPCPVTVDSFGQLFERLATQRHISTVVRLSKLSRVRRRCRYAANGLRGLHQLQKRNDINRFS